jgi:hypothetical protein
MRTTENSGSSASAAHHHNQHQHAYVDSAIIDSPPRHAIWSTERRLAMKPPPGAPMKAPRSSRPYLPNYSPFQQSSSFCETSSGHSRSRVGNNEATSCRTLILPSKTIDEDDDQCMAVSLPFRPTRLTFTYSSEEAATPTTDPTTVLLGPTTTASTPGSVLSWHDDDDAASMDQDDDDVSPRLFHRFGESTLWRYESIEMAEDESDAIFRSAAVMDDDDDNGPPTIQERFTASPLLRGKDDARI